MTTSRHDGNGLQGTVERCGGAREDRTPDLVNAIHALSQLSYGPKERDMVGSDSDAVNPGTLNQSDN